jgi:cardiolipin synthase
MKFYNSTSAAWQTICEACANAKTSIDLEQYILRADGVGAYLMNILATKAREGVNVRIILDAFGSRRLRRKPIVKTLRQAGIKLIFFRPVTALRIVRGAWLPRDHVKALHIDGEQSLIGSMCVADHMLNWRDTLVTCNGDLSRQAQQDFERTWVQILGKSNATLKVNKLPSPCPDQYVAQNPTKGAFSITEALVMRIQAAQRSIYLATPYFFPPKIFRDALVNSRARGVNVTLILSSHTDIPFADHVMCGLIDHWQALGFEVLFYQPTVLHAKYALIDDEWATMGSCNFDVLSLQGNREANLILTSPAHVACLVRHCHDDRLNCVPASAFKPVLSPWDLVIGRLGALIAKHL